MTENGGDIRDNSKNHSSRRPLWSNFDKWIDEEPSTSRVQFEKVKSALLVHCEYIAILYNQIVHDGNGDFNSLNQPFVKFMNIANEAPFLNSTADFPSSNVFDVLSNIFSTQFGDDVGIINDLLKEKLSTLLTPEVDWKKLRFDIHIVRSVYWQLLFTLRLAPVETEGQSEDTMTYDDNRAKLMFGSLIVAILVSIGYVDDTACFFKFSNFVDVDDVAKHLTSLISSAHFRTLAQFFLVGLNIMLKYKEDGNRVTTTSERPHSDSTNKEDEQERLLSESVNDWMKNFGQTYDDIQRRWEANTLNLLTNGFIKPPENSKIVQKNVRPRKSAPTVLTRKRKTEDSRVSADLRKLQPTQQHAPASSQNPQTDRHSKREKIQKSPKKQRDVRRKRPVSPLRLPINELPSTSAATAPKPRVVHPTADDVGLVEPIYIKQADILKVFKDEVERRRKNGSNRTEDAQRVNQAVFKNYDQIHLLNQLVGEASPRSMKAEQATVMQRMKKKWRRGNSDESIDEEEPSEDKEEDEDYEQEKSIPAVKEKKLKAGKRFAKKWKRQY